MGKSLDLTGRVFGRLTVIKKGAKLKDNHCKWLCKCTCGKTIERVHSSLKSSNVQSCGCWRDELIKSRSIKHGLSRSGEFSSWCAMKNRCYNKKHKNYNNYGGRGIEVCERWKNSFIDFFNDMGKKPSPYHSLDRHPNINGNYEPSNCRWGTSPEQMRGTRTNLWFECNGIKMVVEDWRKRWGLSKSAIQGMLKRGRTFEQVFEYYEKKYNS